MSADSLIEYFLLFMGYLLNNGIWNILLYTGIFALPIAFKLLSIWLKVREEGDDEGNKGALALPRMENAIYMSGLILFFTVVPLFELNLNTIQFDQARTTQCHKNVPLPTDSGYSSFQTELVNQQAKVPAWWFLVHSLSKGITRAAIASIPCTVDLKQMQFDVQNTQISDPILAQEIQDFATMCYSKANYKLKSVNFSLGPDEVSDISWIGSNYFLTTPGYYDTYTSTSPRENFPYDSVRDSGYPDVGRGGYPTCKTWWENSDYGLRKRALAGFEPNLLQRVTKIFVSDGEEAMLKWMVSPRNLELSTKGSTYVSGNDAGSGNNWGTELVSQFTFGYQGLTSAVSSEGIKATLPFIQGIIMMILIICIPLVTVLGAYNPKTVILISVAYFGLVFIPFWWELISWLEERMIDIVYEQLGSGRSALGSGTNNSIVGAVSPAASLLISEMNDSRYPNQWILNTLMPMLYLAIPTVWFGAISWAGFNVAGGMDNMMNKGSQNASKQGEQVASAAKTVVNTATKGITKGK